MHNITEIDAIVVPEGSKYRTWHGLETAVPEVTCEVAREMGLHPHIVESPLYLNHPHLQIEPVEKFKALATKDRNGKTQTLNVVTDRYSVIQNADVYRTMSEAFKGTDLPYKLSCIGTLGGLRKYFISVAVGDDDGGFTVNGDKFHSNVNFITSHDGGAFHAHDSLTRIVCQNTLQASMGGAKNIDFKIRHKGDVKAKVASLGSYLNQLLVGREKFAEQMGVLEDTKLSYDDIQKMVSGYFAIKAKKQGASLKDGFSTRTMNAIDGITDLAIYGRGNRGQTAYDVLNGATEYWTSGDGVGVRSEAGKRAYSSEFGTGAANKQQFSEYLSEGKYYEVAAETDAALALSA